MKLISFILILLLVLADFQAQERIGKVSGKIVDKQTAEPLPNANILLYSDEQRTNQVSGAASKLDGTYEIDKLQPGPYWLYIQVLGYQPQTEQFTITQNFRSIEVNVEMVRTNLKLDEVLVEAKQDSNYDISTIKIDPTFVEQLPSISGEVDVYRALTMLPGVTSSSELSNGLYVRGGSPDQTLTLVDGVTVYNPFHLGGFASTFNSDAIEDIKLIKGGFGAEYGGRISSVLDIKLRNGDPFQTKANAGLGLISSRLSVEGPINKDITYFISGRRMYLKTLQDAFLEGDSYPLYEFYDLNGKFSANITDEDQISISAYTGNDNLTAPPKNQDADYDIGWSNTFVNLNWLNVPEEDKYTLFSFNYTSYEFNTLILDKTPNAFKQDFFSTSKIEDYVLKGEGQYLSTDKHSVKIGAEIIVHRFNLLNNNFYTSEIESDERIENSIVGLEGSVFVQDEWKITPLLTANLGLRLYGFPKARYFSPEPRVALKYAVSDKFFIKTAYGVGNQFLHLIVRNDVVLPTDMWFPSTPDIKPTYAQQGIFGVEWVSNDKAYLFSAEGYYKDMQHLYEYSDTSTFTFEQDIENQLTEGSGTAYGVEFFLNKRDGNFTGWIGYTLSWTERNFEGLNRGITFHPRYDRRHDISIVLTYRTDENWEFGATWNYASGQAYTMPTGQYYFPSIYSNNEGGRDVYLDYTNINEYRLPDYHKLDISATYKFKWYELPCQLTLSVYNVYNKQNAFARYIDYEFNEAANTAKPLLKQFTLFPILPTISFSVKI